MLRSLPSLILLLLLFAHAVWALDSASPGKEKSDRADAAIEKKSDLADVPGTEESDTTDVTTEEKADLSDDGDEEPDPADSATEEKADLSDDGEEESDDAENATGEKAGFPNNAGKQASDPAQSAPEKADPSVQPEKEKSDPARAPRVPIIKKADFGVSIEWEEYKWKNGDRDQIFLFTPIYRPTKSLEFSVETPYAINETTEETTRGIGDVTFAGNYVFLWDDYENDDPLLTLEGSIMFDTGSFREGLGKGSNEYTLMPSVSKRVLKSLTLTGQVGYTIVTNGEEDSRKNYLPYAIEVDWEASEQIHVIGGYSSNQHPDVTKPDQKVAELGLSYEIFDWLTVSASYKKGVTSESPKWGIGFGLLIEYPGAD